MSTDLSVEQIRELLRLEPHPIEGGYFAETYRSLGKIPQQALRSAYSGPRQLATAIFYLLTPETFSAIHKLPGDELFHFYLGDPVEMLQLKPDGSAETLILGQDIAHGMHLQHCVPADVWQGARLIAGGKYALLGTTMSPGFDYQDYLTGKRAELTTSHPHHAAMIAALTRP